MHPMSPMSPSLYEESCDFSEANMLENAIVAPPKLENKVTLLKYQENIINNNLSPQKINTNNILNNNLQNSNNNDLIYNNNVYEKENILKPNGARNSIAMLEVDQINETIREDIIDLDDTYRLDDKTVIEYDSILVEEAKDLMEDGYERK
jgi:hypothetical protein